MPFRLSAVIVSISAITPSSSFKQQFKKPVIALPVPICDNDQQAANQNLKFKNLREGIELCAAAIEKRGKNRK
jgi:hypothetical protein